MWSVAPGNVRSLRVAIAGVLTATLACSNSLQGNLTSPDAGTSTGGTAGETPEQSGAGAATVESAGAAGARGSTASGGAHQGGSGGESPSGGNGGDGTGGLDAGTDAGSTPGGAAGGGTVLCQSEPPPAPTGKTLDVTPPNTIAAALANAAAGDRIVLHAGNYAHEDISNRSFASYVFLQAAAGDTVTLPGIHFLSCDHLVLDGIHSQGTFELEGSSHFLMRHVTLDAGTTEDAALQFQGQHASGACHDVTIQDSTIQGGGRTIFVLGSFAPSEQWNHHLDFLRNQITCGSHNCFQISGGRDIAIENNQIVGLGTSGVLTAGATRVTISQNRFRGMTAAAMQIATPGAEWDNYAGVENMISSDVLIANNVVSGWDAGVQLDAATGVSIVYNTVTDGIGVRFNHRVPHDQAAQVILEGNSQIKVWNDILPSLSIDDADPRPVFESNNVVWNGGGGGTDLITGDPKLDGQADYALSAGSPAIDAALINADTPLVDFDNRLRGAKPDIGARELGAQPLSCP